MSVKFRRLNHLGQQPFLCALMAWEKGDDGRVYYAAESVSRFFLQDAIAKYGIGAIRRFWAAMRSELAAKVAAREQFVERESESIDLLSSPRTHEEMCAMLGVEPKRPQC